MSLHPGLKRPTSQSDSTELAEVLRRGWLFGVTYHNMRGAIASATAAWAILLGRSAVARKRPNSREGRHGGRPSHEMEIPAPSPFSFDLSEFLVRVVPKDLNGYLQTIERVFLINDDVLRSDEFKASAVDQFTRIIYCAA
jgi:hypothetical protein